MRYKDCNFRWYHGPCEELTTEEQLENAYENAFRCSLCRPKANADYSKQSENKIHGNIRLLFRRWYESIRYY